MKNKYLCNFQKLLRAFLIFAMFATSSQIAAAQLNVALSNARLDYDKADQGAVQVPIFLWWQSGFHSCTCSEFEECFVGNRFGQGARGKGVSYRIEDGVVYLSKKETRTAVAQVAQQATHKVTGTVTDTTGEPLIGVSIQEVGTSNGAITDIDGNYTLNVSAPSAKLRFSYIGYEAVDIDVNGQAAINVTMKDDSQLLQEVVVTALGIKREKKMLGYAV